MLNTFGIAHGGFLFLLADAAFSYACNTHGPVTLAQSFTALKLLFWFCGTVQVLWLLWCHQRGH